jgi:phage/plasmid-associated DNA primase
VAEQGLGMPEAVRSATGAYREEMDQVSSFLADEIVLEAGCRTPAGELYAAFKA